MQHDSHFLQHNRRRAQRLPTPTILCGYQYGQQANALHVLNEFRGVLAFAVGPLLETSPVLSGVLPARQTFRELGA